MSPKLIHMTMTDYFIECEYIPYSNEAGEEAVAEQVSKQFCCRCGYQKDFEQIPKVVGKEVHLWCFNPKNPYLVELKKRVEQAKQAQATKP